MTFVKTAREIQTRFLANSPTFTEYARSRRGSNHPHVLPLGCEAETLYPPIRTTALDFFVDRRIKWWKAPLSGDDVRAPGPTRNLVSSQVACVNFLLPLASIPDALVAMLRAIDSDVVEVVPMEYALPNGQLTSSLVELEWVGLTGSLEGAAATRGAHVTSADALIVGRTTQDQHRAYLFEWKNAECYSLDDFRGAGKPGQTRRDRYSALYLAADSPFSGDVPIDELLYEPFYQLMRLGLLGAKMISDGEFDVSEARVVVACPTANSEYRARITSPGLRGRSAKSVEDAMRIVARHPEMFRVVDPRALAAAVGTVDHARVKDWLAYNSARYGWPIG